MGPVSKNQLKIRKDANFVSDLLKTIEDTAWHSCQILQTLSCTVGGKFVLNCLPSTWLVMLSWFLDLLVITSGATSFGQIFLIDSDRGLQQVQYEKNNLLIGYVVLHNVKPLLWVLELDCTGDRGSQALCLKISKWQMLRDCVLQWY